MVGQDIGFAGNYYAIQTDHVELISGKKPYSLRGSMKCARGAATGTADINFSRL
jgi:hypothetical protein